jgi:hypothetical protein
MKSKTVLIVVGVAVALGVAFLVLRKRGMLRTDAGTASNATDNANSDAVHSTDFGVDNGGGA